MFRNLLYAAIFALASAVHALPSDIILPLAGDYLGEGHYRTSIGQVGTYALDAQVMPGLISVSYLRNNELFQFAAAFDMNDLGFFTATVTIGDDEDEESFSGNGYCIDNNCHVEIIFDYGTFEQTITFGPDPQRFEQVGSLKTFFDDGEPVTNTWRERMVRIREFAPPTISFPPFPPPIIPILPPGPPVPVLPPPIFPPDDEPVFPPPGDEPIFPPPGDDEPVLPPPGDGEPASWLR